MKKDLLKNSKFEATPYEYNDMIKIAETIFGEEIRVKEGMHDVFALELDKMLYGFPEEEREHFLNAFFGIIPEDEAYERTLRRLRHPVRTEGIRKCIERGQNEQR